MSDRAPRARKNTSESRGTSSIRGEAGHWFNSKPNYQHAGRIRGLTATEIGIWITKAPAKGHLLAVFVERAHELADLGKMNKDTWGEHMTNADFDTFEAFVNRESRVDWLNCLIEAEIERDEPRGKRIGTVNQRKQEL